MNMPQLEWLSIRSNFGIQIAIQYDNILVCLNYILQNYYKYNLASSILYITYKSLIFHGC